MNGFTNLACVSEETSILDRQHHTVITVIKMKEHTVVPRYFKAFQK
jgi:hypothetical protein